MSPRFRGRALRAVFGAALSVLGIATSACGGGGGGGVPANGIAPTANAGPDQVGRVGMGVTLNGLGSSHPGGGTLDLQWAQTGGPAVVFLTAPHSFLPNFVPPVTGAYDFDLTVTTGGLTDIDRVQVVVVDDLAIGGPRAPAAELRVAALSHAIFLASDPAALGLSPPSLRGGDGTVVPNAFVDVLSNPADNPLPAALAGLLRVDAIVNGAGYARLYYAMDPEYDDAADVEFSDGSTAPLRTFAVVGSAYLLDGSRSHDDGTLVNFHWVQPSAHLDLDTATPVLGVVPLIPDTYACELVVTDDVGLASFPRTVMVPVVASRPIAPGPPLAKVSVTSGTSSRIVAGRSELVGEVGRAITLDGSASLAFTAGRPASGPTALTFLWRQVSGPLADAVIATASQTASFEPVSPGACEFELQVTDTDGVSDVADVWVSIAMPGFTAPVAGIASIPDPVLSGTGKTHVNVTLDGTPSVGMPPLTYHWTQVGGVPLFVTQPSLGKGLVSIDQPGAYEFELRLFDGHGFSPPARVTFQVQ